MTYKRLLPKRSKRQFRDPGEAEGKRKKGEEKQGGERAAIQTSRRPQKVF